MRQRKNYWIILLSLITIFLLTSCGGNNKSEESTSNLRDADSGMNSSALEEATPAANIQSFSATGDDETTTQQTTNQRIIIKSASLTLTVENPAEKVQEITQLAENSGGWIVDSHVTKFDESLTAEITIRVPAEQFTSTLNTIKTGVLEVNNEDIVGQDVTQEYTDLESELVNLELAEEQIQGFLDLANNTDEVLRIHDKLTAVHGQIETTQGRLRYYSESAAYSSIKVYLHQPEGEEEKTVVKKDDPWKPGKTIESAFNSLLATLQVIADVLIWLIVYLLPIVVVLILLGSPLWFGWRYWQRRQAQQSTAN